MSKKERKNKMTTQEIRYYEQIIKTLQEIRKDVKELNDKLEKKED